MASIGIAGKQRRGPEIVSRPLFVIPRARIRRAVVDQVEFGIVRDPTPCRASANFPFIRWPGGDTEVLAFHPIVWRLEVVADQLLRNPARSNRLARRSSQYSRPAPSASRA